MCWQARFFGSVPAGCAEQARKRTTILTFPRFQKGASRASLVPGKSPVTPDAAHRSFDNPSIQCRDLFPFIGSSNPLFSIPVMNLVLKMTQIPTHTTAAEWSYCPMQCFKRRQPEQRQPAPRRRTPSLVIRLGVHSRRAAGCLSLR